MDEQIPKAPEGMVYVCKACGKTAESVYDFSDVACCVNAVLCKKDTLVYDGGRVVKADRIEDAQ